MKYTIELNSKNPFESRILHNGQVVGYVKKLALHADPEGFRLELWKFRGKEQANKTFKISVTSTGKPILDKEVIVSEAKNE